MNYLHMYKTLLPCAMVPSLMTSYFISLDETLSKKPPQTRLINVLGLLSVGTMVGLAYPISVPLLAGNFLYRNR